MADPSPRDDVVAAAWTALPCPVRLLAPGGEVVAENAAWRSAFGDAPASSAPSSERAGAGHPSALRAAAAGEARVLPVVAPDGRRYDAEYFPVRDASGAVTHVGVLCRETGAGETPAVSDEALREAAAPAAIDEQLRFLVDMLPLLVWSTRPDGYHDFYNRRWYEFTGASRGETAGAGWNDPLHPDDQARAWQRWQRSLASGEDYEIEYRFRRHDGVYRWFLGRAVAMRDEAGRIARWFGTCTDIDDAKRLEEGRAAVLAEAEANNRMKDEFLATVSHELRTPLTAILGWARIQRVQPEMVPKAMDVIERNALAQAALIEEILETSRIVTGKVRLEAAPLDLALVVSSAVDTVRPTADAKGVSVRLDVVPDVGRVVGDAARLQQVAWNLLSNAVKFTPAGGHVTARVRRTDDGVELVVEDTGGGIAPEFLPYVFDRFRQADGGTTRVHGGLGLGLAIVKHLVELHGGTTRAESRGIRKGSTFTVTIPFGAGFVAEPPLARRAGRGSEPAPPIPSRLDGVDVLVVEDEPDARDLIATILRQAGAAVREADSVAAALAEVSRRTPDVLVSDVGMPGQDGYSLARTLRASLRGPSPLRAVALSAYARDEDRAQALGAGFDRHLTKPVEPGVLVRTVAELHAGA